MACSHLRTGGWNFVCQHGPARLQHVVDRGESTRRVSVGRPFDDRRQVRRGTRQRVRDRTDLAAGVAAGQQLDQHECELY